MTSYTCYATDADFNPWKHAVACTAKFAGVEVNFPPGFGPAKARNDVFARNCNPMKRNPVLQTEDGYIAESGAIVRYIARLGEKNNAGLYGQTPFEMGQVDQWIDFGNGELGVHCKKFIRDNFGVEKIDREAGLSQLKDAFAALELWLEVRTFLDGERVTAADIWICAWLDCALQFAKEPCLFTDYKNVLRYYRTIYNQPKYQEGLKQCAWRSEPLSAVVQK